MSAARALAWGLACALAGSGAVAAPRAHRAAQAPTAIAGTFESRCQALVEGSLHYTDLIDLKPQSARATVAHYRKRFYAAPGCAAPTLLVTLSLPVSRWTHDGTTTVEGKTVQKVIAESTTGRLTARIHRPDKVRDEPDAFVITYGPDNAVVPLDKTSEGGRTLELRLLEGDRLYVSNMEQPAPDQYPPGIDFDNPFVRVKKATGR